MIGIANNNLQFAVNIAIHKRGWSFIPDIC